MGVIEGKIEVVNGEPAEIILILARNIRYAQGWCDLYGVNPRSRKVKYITHEVDLHGFNDVYYVDLGTDNWVLREYFERLKAAGRIKSLHGLEESFIGPQLPPDDIIYRKAQPGYDLMAREVYRHQTPYLKEWLAKRASEQPARYLSGNYYIRSGRDDQVMSVEEYLK